MKIEDSFCRLLALLLLTLAICLGLYWLPDSIAGYQIKKVDLLSDLRVKPKAVSLDSLWQELEKADTLRVDSAVIRDSVIQKMGIDSAALAVRDSLYKVLYAMRGADSTGTHIEDYSVGHVGLKRFFSQLRDIQHINRPVRIAFLGDSFIEGDIMVADFRSELQQIFGGRGVGFVPVSSVAAQYRPTVEQRAEGWKVWSLLNDHEYRFTLPGMAFGPEEGMATLWVKNATRYPELHEVSSLKLLYEQNSQTEMDLVCNGEADTFHLSLPPTEEIVQYEKNGRFTEAFFRFRKGEGFKALGVALEDNSGIVVDNFSLRGTSGMPLEHLDSLRCRELQRVRPYDLIVLQYGLNVVSDSVMQYGWYGSRMTKVVEHLRSCFPETDLLMLGVSDRSRQVEGNFETMPAVLALLHTQRKTARRCGIPFWNVFGAMGGENSMVRFVEQNWASKDYTHLSFRGGKEIAKAFVEALLSEKEFYDEAEKIEKQ